MARKRRVTVKQQLRDLAAPAWHLEGCTKAGPCVCMLAIRKLLKEAVLSPSGVLVEMERSGRTLKLP